jgi:nucleoid DNA-binding protein
MDELYKVVSQKTGLTLEQSKAASKAVLDYLKTKLPAPIATQIDGFLSGTSPVEAIKNVGGMFGKS